MWGTVIKQKSLSGNFEKAFGRKSHDLIKTGSETFIIYNNWPKKKKILKFDNLYLQEHLIVFNEFLQIQD